MSLLYILVGLPATGKTTYRNELIVNHPFHKWRPISIDDNVTMMAAAIGKSYDDGWKECVQDATLLAIEQTKEAFAGGYDVIWDATNLTMQSRMRKIDLCPADYQRYAVVFDEPPEAEYAARLAARPGKTIPPEVITKMRAQFKFPMCGEGFHEIIRIATT
jgi:predicted kinase